MSDSGTWQVLPSTCPINPVHAAVLRTGQVFFYGGSGNDPNNPPGPSVILDLSSGSFSSQDPPIVSGASIDLFCAGQSFGADGSLLVAGGTLQYDPFYGVDTAFLFSPDTSQWTQVPSMNSGRWYPTIVTLGYGQFFALTGFDIQGNLSQQPELYTDATGWQAFPPTSSLFPMYANLFLLIRTAVSFASFILTTSVERRLNTAPLGAGSTEMMQDHPLHVLVRVTSFIQVQTPSVVRTRLHASCSCLLAPPNLSRKYRWMASSMQSSLTKRPVCCSRRPKISRS
jgi:hypothetical protein